VGVAGSFDEPALVQSADRGADGLGGDPLTVGELAGGGGAVAVQPRHDGQLGEGQLVVAVQGVQLAQAPREPADGQSQVVGNLGNIIVGHNRQPKLFNLGAC
jgi:hypothetical protein